MKDSSTTSPGTASPASPASAAGATTPGKKFPSPTPRSPTASPRSAAFPPANAAAAPADTGVLEADDNFGDGDDGDSTLGLPTDASDTTSIRSYIFKYRKENGRTYHAYQDGGEYKPYFLPNDETEGERLDLQHHLFWLTQGDQLFTCPYVKENPPKRVFDAGCGTGIWALDFGDLYPDSWVVGVDLSVMQPRMVGPNVEFFVDDLEADWTFNTPFDFIYARFLTGSIKDWPRFFAQSFQHMNPGGWIETCDIMSPLVSDDGSLTENSSLLRWNKLLLEATIKAGVPADSLKHYKQQMRDAGFQHVTEVKFKWPTNTWPKDKRHKEIGWWNNANMVSGLQGLTIMLLTQVLGWSTIEVQVLLAGVRNDMNNRDIHAYWPIWVIYGQKPK